MPVYTFLSSRNVIPEAIFVAMLMRSLDVRLRDGSSSLLPGKTVYIPWCPLDALRNPRRSP